MSEILEKLEQLPFWENLTPEEKELTSSLTVIKDFEKGNILHSMDKDCLGLAVVLKGSFRAYMMSEEGREITLYHVLEGEYDVLTASCIMYQITFDTQMIIEEDSRIMVVPTTALRRLKEENIYMRSFIYEALTERFSDVMWTIQQILFYGIDQRIAAFLVRRGMDQGCFTEKAMQATAAGSTRPGSHAAEGNGAAAGSRTASDNGAAQAGNDGYVCPEIKVTHEEIAREISTAREVVARIIRHFVDDGLIETGRGKIRILDPRGLYALAEDLL